GGGPGVTVEPRQRQPADHGELVVAADDGLRALRDQLDAGQRIGAVPYGVAQAEQPVRPIPTIGEHGAECLEVAVDVRENGVPHDVAITQADAGRCSRRIRSSTPLMKRLDSVVPNFLAISIASLLAALGGTWGCPRSS